MIDENAFVIVDPQANLPFSKGLMAQSLMATGLQPERAYEVAAAVERSLRRTGGRYGLAAMCIGVGQGIAIIIERV